MPTVADLDQTHPEYDPAYYSKLSALYHGGRIWHKMAQVWLPKRDLESTEDHRKRMATAVYENKAGPVIDTIAQWLNEEPLVVADATLATALAPPDGATPLDQVMTDVITNALVHKRGWVYVTLPQTSANTRGEQRRAGDLQPEYRVVDSESVLDWELDSRGRVVWAMIRELIETRAGPTARRVWSIQWTYVSTEYVQKFTLALEDDEVSEAGHLAPTKLKDKQVTPGQVVETGDAGCPLACLALKDGLWAMDRLADPAAGHLRTAHALDHLLDRSAFAVLLIRSKGESLNAPAVGPGYALQVGPDDSAEFIEPSGAAFEALRNTKQDYEQAVYRTMRQMALATRTDGGGTASGAAKARDMDPMRIVLSAYRVVVLTFAKRLIHLAASVVGARVPADLMLSGLDAWKERTLDEFFVAASLAMDAIAMSETLGRAVAKTKAQMLLAGTPGAVDLEQIEHEIDQADPMEALMIGGKSLGDDVAATLAGTTGGEKDERAAEDKRAGQKKSGQGRRGAKGGGG